MSASSLTTSIRLAKRENRRHFSGEVHQPLILRQLVETAGDDDRRFAGERRGAVDVRHEPGRITHNARSSALATTGSGATSRAFFCAQAFDDQARRRENAVGGAVIEEHWCQLSFPARCSR